MTNNPTIDGVSRATIEQALLDAQRVRFPTDKHICNLRALIDAPVVERQPFGYVFKRKAEVHGWNFFQGVMAFESMEAYEIKPVYEAPQDFADQQSTIAQLQARIAELESGRGEPVAWVELDESMPHGKTLDWYQEDIKALPLHANLYTAPPAPVAIPVDLRKRLIDVWLFLDGQAELNGCVWGEKPEGRHTYWWRKELRAVIEDVNACLDATAALNGERK